LGIICSQNNIFLHFASVFIMRSKVPPTKVHMLNSRICCSCIKDMSASGYSATPTCHSLSCGRIQSFFTSPYPPHKSRDSAAKPAEERFLGYRAKHGSDPAELVRAGLGGSRVVIRTLGPTRLQQGVWLDPHCTSKKHEKV
jgi:hypothetical protein